MQEARLFFQKRILLLTSKYRTGEVKRWIFQALESDFILKLHYIYAWKSSARRGDREVRTWAAADLFFNQMMHEMALPSSLQMKLCSYLQIPGGGIKRPLSSLWLWHLWTSFCFHAGQKIVHLKGTLSSSTRCPEEICTISNLACQEIKRFSFSQEEWAKRTRSQWEFQRQKTL